MQRQQYTSYKPEVIALRKQGKTYGEIQKAIEKAEKLLKDATDSDTILSVTAQKLKNIQK